MKYLIVKPLGGLANRMRVVESAYSYSKNSAASLVIVWERNGILNAKYSDCFSPIQGVTIIEADYTGDTILAKAKRKSFNILEGIGRWFFTNKKLYDNGLESMLTNGVTDEQAKAFFDKLATKSKGIFIETCFEFYPNTSLFRLGIREEIKQKAMASLTHYPSVVGIHIRRTDNIDSIEKSPKEKVVSIV